MKARKIILVAAFIPIVAITLFMTVKQLTNPDSVYICGAFYKTGCNELVLDCRNKSYRDLRNLKFFSSLDHLRISALKTEKEILLSDLNVSEIWIDCCDIKNTSFFGSLENAKQIVVVGGKINLLNFSNESAKNIVFYSCDIDYFEQLGVSANAEYLTIYDCEFTGTGKTDTNGCVMYDSSVFADFDKVKTLKIYDTKIEDISGFLDMQALTDIHFTTDQKITDEQIAELENAGITVHLHKPMYSDES